MSGNMLMGLTGFQVNDLFEVGLKPLPFRGHRARSVAKWQTGEGFVLS
jgi:hypothetical protein